MGGEDKTIILTEVYQVKHSEIISKYIAYSTELGQLLAELKGLQ